MEDILSLYEESYDPLRPVICFDERPCQLIGEVLVPMPMRPGREQRQDYEYERNGTCCVLLAVEPLRGWRFTQVRERRTAIDYAQFMKELVETHYPLVDRIRLVQDNLNTHTPGSFYEAFEPQTAFALGQKFELHYTPVKAKPQPQATATPAKPQAIQADLPAQPTHAKLAAQPKSQAAEPSQAKLPPNQTAKPAQPQPQGQAKQSYQAGPAEQSEAATKPDEQLAEKWTRDNLAEWLDNPCQFAKAQGRTWRELAENQGEKIAVKGRPCQPRAYLHALESWASCGVWQRMKARVALELGKNGTHEAARQG